MTNIDQRPPSSGAEPLASSGAAAPPPAAAPRAKQRSPLRTVALPSEHGGWGLTLEPVLLGLLVNLFWPRWRQRVRRCVG